MDAKCSVCGERATRRYIVTRLDTGKQLKGYLCRDCPLEPKWEDPQPKPADVKIDIYRNAAPPGDGQYLKESDG